MVIKRNIRGYFGHIVAIILVSKPIINFDLNQVTSSDCFVIPFFVLSLLSLIWRVITPNYIYEKDDFLIINGLFFNKRKILKNEIQQFIEDYQFFSFWYIVLNNGKKIRLDSTELNSNDIKKLNHFYVQK